MSRLILGGIAMAMISGLAVGCSSEKQTESAVIPAHSHNDHSAKETTDVNNDLAELSQADQELADRQKICPVSKEPLGSMGTPIVVTKDDRRLLVCCAGCVDKAKENFDAFYAELNPSIEP